MSQTELCKTHSTVLSLCSAGDHDSGAAGSFKGATGKSISGSMNQCDGSLGAGGGGGYKGASGSEARAGGGSDGCRAHHGNQTLLLLLKLALACTRKESCYLP